MQKISIDAHAIVNGKHWIGTAFEGGGCWIELPDNDDAFFKIITIPQYGGIPTVQKCTKTISEALRSASAYST